jgi:hypothetical protein
MHPRSTLLCLGSKSASLSKSSLTPIEAIETDTGDSYSGVVADV